MDKVWEDWFQHQRTWELLQKYTPQFRAAHKDLLELCSRSTDAEVRGAFEKYRGLEEAIHMLKGQQKERHEDE